MRVCPYCPDCNNGQYGRPCQDYFGSNATPMGGGAGRADASIGAVEAQQAEGVLHLHLFIFCKWQFSIAMLVYQMVFMEKGC